MYLVTSYIIAVIKMLGYQPADPQTFSPVLNRDKAQETVLTDDHTMSIRACPLPATDV
jgi:hypothetical protein